MQANSKIEPKNLGASERKHLTVDKRSCPVEKERSPADTPSTVEWPLGSANTRVVAQNNMSKGSREEDQRWQQRTRKEEQLQGKFFHGKGGLKGAFTGDDGSRAH